MVNPTLGFGLELDSDQIFGYPIALRILSSSLWMMADIARWPQRHTQLTTQARKNLVQSIHKACPLNRELNFLLAGIVFLGTEGFVRLRMRITASCVACDNVLPRSLTRDVA